MRLRRLGPNNVNLAFHQHLNTLLPYASTHPKVVFDSIETEVNPMLKKLHEKFPAIFQEISHRFLIFSLQLAEDLQQSHEQLCIRYFEVADRYKINGHFKEALQYYEECYKSYFAAQSENLENLVVLLEEMLMACTALGFLEPAAFYKEQLLNVLDCISHSTEEETPIPCSDPPQPIR